MSEGALPRGQLRARGLLQEGFRPDPTPVPAPQLDTVAPRAFVSTHVPECMHDQDTQLPAPSLLCLLLGI